MPSLAGVAVDTATMGHGNALYQVSIDTLFAITQDAITPDQILAGLDAKNLIEGSTNSTFIDGSCATNEISFTGGQKSDIEVTSLCSTEQEVTNGLAAPAEISISRNWAPNDPMLPILRTAYDENKIHGFVVEFPGMIGTTPAVSGYAFYAEIRQFTWSVATAGKVAASYTLRVRGKPYMFLNRT
ncbi:hypothetical protein SB5439_04986 [Klebsiella variicola]|uniref:phage tail protein n=1 Tax=Klebsiella variicola TaxID=244366 RepID=UPI00109D28EB|nr:phage tail protein [Klebsiella variicola]VGQ11711.1 hypothetical protein SB5439_04986 [Klebsiella variicola]